MVGKRNGRDIFPDKTKTQTHYVDSFNMVQYSSTTGSLVSLQQRSHNNNSKRISMQQTNPGSDERCCQFCNNNSRMYCLYFLKMQSQSEQIESSLASEFNGVAQYQSGAYRKCLQNPIAIIRISLFQKYSQSQNYYYTRDINDLLSDIVRPMTIDFKDHITMDDEDEYLKRLYKLPEYPSKISLLAEYYKFHTDIPRIFMEPIDTILNKFYDKKRKFEYYRIARLIADENRQNPERAPKGIVGDKPSPINSQEEDEDDDWGQSKNQFVKNTQILKDMSEYNRMSEYRHSNKNVSHTLQEICQYLDRPRSDYRNITDDQMPINDNSQMLNFINYLNDQTNTQKPTTPAVVKISIKTDYVKTSGVSPNSKVQIQQIDKNKLELTIKKQLDQLNQGKYVINAFKSSEQADMISQKPIQTQHSIVKKNSITQLAMQSIRKLKTSENGSSAQVLNINQQMEITIPRKLGQFISNNISPTAKGSLMQKRDLFQPTSQKAAQPFFNKNIQEDTSNSVRKLLRQGALTHRPSSSTQLFFQTVQKQGQEYRKRLAVPEIKKLSLGCVDQVLQLPLSSRSQYSTTPILYQELMTNKQKIHQRNITTISDRPQSMHSVYSIQQLGKDKKQPNNTSKHTITLHTEQHQSGSLTDRSQKEQCKPIGSKPFNSINLINFQQTKLIKVRSYDQLTQLSPQELKIKYQQIQNQQKQGVWKPSKEDKKKKINLDKR